MLFRRAELPALIEIAGRQLPLIARRRTGSRGIRLSADPILGAVRISLPARGGIREALALIDGHRGWLAGQILKWPVARPFLPGSRIPFDGGELLIDWAEHYPRTPQRMDATLRVGGPRSLLAGRVLRWLKAAALADITPATHALAATVAQSVQQIRVGDPRARWGSCASGGRIAFSWRLILAPPIVRHHIVAHEVAHLVYANHGPEFHTLLARLDGNQRQTRAWLRGHGAGLHWVGRDP